MAYKNSVATNRVEHKLDEILAALGGSENQKKRVSSKEDTAEIRERSEKAEQANPAVG